MIIQGLCDALKGLCLNKLMTTILICFSCCFFFRPVYWYLCDTVTLFFSLLQMVKLFTSGYESPSSKNSEGEVLTNSENRSTKTLVSPKRASLLQNLNRNNGNSVVMVRK